MNSLLSREERTGAERVEILLEKLTRGKVVTLGSGALEVVCVILETRQKRVRAEYLANENIKLASSLSGSCLGTELRFPCQRHTRAKKKKKEKSPSNGAV